MGIRIEKKNIVFESICMTPIEPNYVFTNEEEVKKYLKENPFPETKYYTANDLFGDTQSEGMWTLMDEITNEQQNYIVDMVSYFL